MCGGNSVYIPESGCTDCDRALYLIEQLTERIDNMSFKAYRGTYEGVGVAVTTVPVLLTGYEYSASDTFLVFVNGLNLVASEFSVSGSGDTVTVTLDDSISMQTVDVLEVVALKYVNE